MNDDTNQMVKLGLGIVLLVAVIGAVIALFSLAQNSMSGAKQGLSNTLDATEQMQFAQYDNKGVTGQDIFEAIDKFNGKAIGIIVVNKRGIMFYGSPFDGQTIEKIQAFNNDRTKVETGKMSDKATAKNLIKAFEGTNIKWTDSAATLDVKDAQGTVSQTEPDLTAKVIVNNSQWLALLNPDEVAAGSYNKAYGISQIAGNAQYIKQTAKYHAHLTHEAVGLPANGIIFIQKPN